MKKTGGLAIAALVAVGLSGRAVAADLGAPEQEEAAASAAVVEEWTFTVAPYLWVTGMSGKTGLFGLPAQNIDVSFSDIVESLDFAFMGAGEARYGPWSFGMDLMYSDLSTAVGTPRGIITDNIDVTSTLLVATLVGGYAVVSEPAGHLDVVAGARLWSSETEFEFRGGALDGTTRSDSATWVDPLIGVKGRYDVGDSRFFLTGWGLIGGFGVGSDFTWDAMASVGYEINDSFTVTAGYRGLGVDYADDGFVFDVTQHGPIFGGIFRF